MADKKKPLEGRTRNRIIDQEPENNRHIENTRAASRLEQKFPRNNTENI
ncbi:hypothetical protein ACQUWN_12225 [Rossellomorea aquimaris]|nr:hypothetical protein [Rossellomorea vietnamensis]